MAGTRRQHPRPAVVSPAACPSANAAVPHRGCAGLSDRTCVNLIHRSDNTPVTCAHWLVTRQAAGWSLTVV